MNIIFDDGKIVIYRGNIDGKYYDVSYDKVHRRATIIIYSNILGDSQFYQLIGKIIKDSVQSFNLTPDKIQFEFHPSLDLERDNANKAMNAFGISGKIVMQKNEKKKDDISKYFKANMIEKNVSGKIVYCIERQADNNSQGYLLEDVNLNDLQNELDSVLSDSNIDINNLSEIEIASLVLDRISEKKKQYYLESSMNYEAKNSQEEAALQATNLDDKVNPEIGVVKKDTGESFDNSYRTIEREGDHYHEVNPSVHEVSDVSTSQNDAYMTQNEIESRDNLSVYYLDSYSGDIYNDKEEVIGNIREGYSVNYETNHLMKGEVDLGPLDDFKNMGHGNDLDKPKTRVLEKPSDNSGKVSILILTSIIVILLVIFGILIYSFS